MMPLSSFVGFAIVFGVIAGFTRVGWGVWKQQPRNRLFAVLIVLSPLILFVVGFYFIGRIPPPNAYH